MRQAQDAEAQAAQASIPLGIESDPVCVIASISLNDEADGGSEEVNDVVADDDLAPKLNAQLFTPEVQPEQGLGRGRAMPKPASALFECERAKWRRCGWGNGRRQG